MHIGSPRTSLHELQSTDAAATEAIDGIDPRLIAQADQVDGVHAKKQFRGRSKKPVTKPAPPDYSPGKKPKTHRAVKSPSPLKYRKSKSSNQAMTARKPVQAEHEMPAISSHSARSHHEKGGSGSNSKKKRDSTWQRPPLLNSRERKRFQQDKTLLGKKLRMEKLARKEQEKQFLLLKSMFNQTKAENARLRKRINNAEATARQFRSKYQSVLYSNDVGIVAV
jgi:hypothetical protein